MRTALQNHMDWRRRGKPSEAWPEDVVKVWEARYGDRAIQQLVAVAARPDTLHNHVEKYLKAVRLIIHRDLGRAMVARSLTGETA
jgi:hypothetical protein